MGAEEREQEEGNGVEPAAAMDPPSDAAESSSGESAGREIWERDLRRLKDNAREFYPDIAWADETSSRVVYGHRFAIYSRETQGFLKKYLRVQKQAQNKLLHHPTVYLVDDVNDVEAHLAHAYEDRPVGLQRGLSVRGGTRLSSVSTSALPKSGNATSATLQVPSTSRRKSNPDIRVDAPVPASGESSFADNQTSILGTSYNTSASSSKYDKDGSYVGASTSLSAPRNTSFVDTSLRDAHEHAGSVLQEDFLYAWRSQLFSDLRLTLPKHPGTWAVHRSMLAVRSEYLRALLSQLASGKKSLELPSPPFTPAATHFFLGWVYTGSLFVDPRRFDLETAFDLYACAELCSARDMKEQVVAHLGRVVTAPRAARMLKFAAEHQLGDLADKSVRVLAENYMRVWHSRDVQSLPVDLHERFVAAVCDAIDASLVVTTAGHLKELAQQESAQGSAPTTYTFDPIIAHLEKLLVFQFPDVQRSPPFYNLVTEFGAPLQLLQFLLLLVLRGLKSHPARMNPVRDSLADLSYTQVTMDAKAVIQETLAALSGTPAPSTAPRDTSFLSSPLEPVQLVEPARSPLLNRAAARHRALSGFQNEGAQKRPVGLTVADLPPDAVPSPKEDKTLPADTAPKMDKALSGPDTSPVDRQDQSPAEPQGKPVSPVAPPPKELPPPPPVEAAAPVPPSPPREMPSAVPPSPLREVPPAPVDTPRGKKEAGRGGAGARLESPLKLASPRRGSPATRKLESHVAPDYSTRHESPTKPHDVPPRRTVVVSEGSFSRSPSGRIISLDKTSAPPRPDLDLDPFAEPPRAGSKRSFSKGTSVVGSKDESTGEKGENKGDETGEKMGKIGKNKGDETGEKAGEKAGENKGEGKVAEKVESKDAADLPGAPPRQRRVPRKKTDSAKADASDSAKTDTSGTAKTDGLGTAREPAKLETARDPSRRMSEGGMALREGIPCIVTLDESRFKAFVKYIGPVKFAGGDWIGVECDARDVADKVVFTDGAVDGVTYWRLESSVSPSAAMLQTLAPRTSVRADKPAAPRGLFVRPEQIVYIL